MKKTMINNYSEGGWLPRMFRRKFSCPEEPPPLPPPQFRWETSGRNCLLLPISISAIVIHGRIPAVTKFAKVFSCKTCFRLEAAEEGTETQLSPRLGRDERTRTISQNLLIKSTFTFSVNHEKNNERIWTEIC